MNLLVVAATEGSGSVHIDKVLPSLKTMCTRLEFAGWDRRRVLAPAFMSDSIRFRMIFRGWGYANRWLMLGLPLWMGRVFIYLLGKRPDAVMAIDFDCGLPAAVAKIFTGTTLIYNIRDNYAMRPSIPSVLRSLVRALDLWVIRRADMVIVPDESRIDGCDSGSEKKFVVIRNCARDISPVPVLDLDRPFTVYAMGYLRKGRGIELLITAAQRLLDVRVLIAGKCYDADLEEVIKSSPNVDYRGFLSQEESLRLCFEADVVFTFYDPASEINRKAASNKWSDAMMAGKPILINTEVLKSEWIESEDIGFVCRYGDVEELVRTLEYIRLHPDEARRKGTNGRRIYESGYNWPAMESRLYRSLKELASRKGLPMPEMG